jgi:hypothetical protein
MNVAVADEGGNILSHVRMDGAWIGSIDISMKKAYTSRAFDIATKDLATQSQSGGQFFGIHTSNDGKIMIYAGGIPLLRDGKVVGAIGVSGGSVSRTIWWPRLAQRPFKGTVSIDRLPRRVGCPKFCDCGPPLSLSKRGPALVSAHPKHQAELTDRV